MTNTPIKEKSSKIAGLFIILHLCIVFTVLVSSAGYPFLGELFVYKKQILIYHNLMGDQTLGIIGSGMKDDSLSLQKKLERNKQRFSALSQKSQREILSQYQALSAQSNQPFFQKLKRSFHIVFFELPLFEKGWLFFSIFICVLLLLKRENALQTTWILPLLTLCYIVNNQLHGKEAEISPDLTLFPSEKVIVEEYLREPLSSPIQEQQKQLLLGWKRYLIIQWSKEIPANEPMVFEQQAEKGEYAFNLARIHSIRQQTSSLPFQEKDSPWLCFLYLGWNLLFVRSQFFIKSGRNT